MTPFSNALGWLSHFRSLHVTTGPNRVEKPQSKAAIETQCGGREHARTATLPIGSEASLDAGSSRRRAPVAAFGLGANRERFDGDQPGPRLFPRVA